MAEKDTLLYRLGAEQARTKSLAKQLKETAEGYGEFIKGIVQDTEFLVGEVDKVARIALVQLLKRLDEVVPTASEAVWTAQLESDKALKNNIGGEEGVIQLLKRLV
jgi:alpha-D-ribose 1-methylphosphonate 5-triphosphate synthase subunit PhnI